MRERTFAPAAIGLLLAVSTTFAQDFPDQPSPVPPTVAAPDNDAARTQTAETTGSETNEPGRRTAPQDAIGTPQEDEQAEPGLAEDQAAERQRAADPVDADLPLRPFWAGDALDTWTADPADDGSQGHPPTAGDAGSLRAVDDPGTMGPPLPDPEANEFGVSPMEILGARVLPATRERLSWTTGQSFSGSVMETPVIVVHGAKPGPRLCLTAGVHGDELNGVEVVRRLAYKDEPEHLSGTLIAVPIVNLLGFSRGSRYLPDRRDLNRFFPGSQGGSSASRIAHSFFQAIIRHCDALVDFHTGSFDRANLPQVRGDLTIPAVVEFTRGFGATAVLHSPGAIGMLRHAATAQNVPSVTFEIGAPLRLQPEEIDHGVQAIETLMFKMGMIENRRRWAEPQAVFYESRWVRVDHGGMLFSRTALGDRVQRGQVLGQVIDPVSNRMSEIRAPEGGRIIGMALNQLVLPGFAAYHLGIAAGEEQVVSEAGSGTVPGDERFMEYDQLDEDGPGRRRDSPSDDEPAVSEPPAVEPENER